MNEINHYQEVFSDNVSKYLMNTLLSGTLHHENIELLNSHYLAEFMHNVKTQVGKLPEILEAEWDLLVYQKGISVGLGRFHLAAIKFYLSLIEKSHQDSTTISYIFNEREIVHLAANLLLLIEGYIVHRIKEGYYRPNYITHNSWKFSSQSNKSQQYTIGEIAQIHPEHFFNLDSVYSGDFDPQEAGDYIKPVFPPTVGILTSRFDSSKLSLLLSSMMHLKLSPDSLEIARGLVLINIINEELSKFSIELLKSDDEYAQKCLSTFETIIWMMYKQFIENKIPPNKEYYVSAKLFLQPTSEIKTIGDLITNLPELLTSYFSID